MSLLDRTIAYFRGFWALVEGGQRDIKEIEPEQILSSFSDFWAMVTLEEDVSDNQEQGDAGSESEDESENESEAESESEDSPEEDFLSMQHFAKMYVLEAEQRYLYRTLQINDNILQDQERRLKESRRATKSLVLERNRLARMRKKMVTAQSHKILGSFAQFWRNIGNPETGSEEPDHLENAGDFFRLNH